MYGHHLSQIRASDKYARQELEALLAREGIRLDANLDYTVGLYDGDGKLIATGSCFANTLRCLAVEKTRQSEGLLGTVLTHLIEYEMRRGISHLFLYTGTDKAFYFSDLGFAEIARVDGVLSFMENRSHGFSSYLEGLAKQKHGCDSAALVMNCNPFTLGHRRLIEAATVKQAVHLFVVSEDASFFPFKDRLMLVEKGCADLKNVVLHETGSYMISNSVFPSYFLEDDQAVIRAQAKLDVTLFKKIAHVLGITARFVGDEPYSKVTRIYNEIMSEELPKAGIDCVIIPRKEINGEPISASRVRQLLSRGRLEEVRALVPPSAFDYLQGAKGREVIEKLINAENVVHY